MKKFKDRLKVPKWVYWVWLPTIISLAISIACFLQFVFPHVEWDVSAVSVGIVLTFVGILATFVVVNNYMQVRDIEKKTDNIVNEKVMEIYKEFEKIVNLKIKTSANDFNDLVNNGYFWHAFELCVLGIECYSLLNNHEGIKNYINDIRFIYPHVASEGRYILKEMIDKEYFTEENKKKWIEILEKVKSEDLKIIIDFLKKKEPYKK